MTLMIDLRARHCPLTEDQERRIRHQLDGLAKRVEQFPDPVATLALREQPPQRRITAELRLRLGPHAGHLVSHQEAETPDHAARLAVDDIKRELERRLSMQRGDASFGVPSRRLPEKRSR